MRVRIHLFFAACGCESFVSIINLFLQYGPWIIPVKEFTICKYFVLSTNRGHVCLQYIDSLPQYHQCCHIRLAPPREWTVQWSVAWTGILYRKNRCKYFSIFTVGGAVIFIAGVVFTDFYSLLYLYTFWSWGTDWGEMGTKFGAT